MNQFKDIYMQDFFRNVNINQEDNLNETINKTYIEVLINITIQSKFQINLVIQRKIVPEQPINAEETLALIENDYCQTLETPSNPNQ